MSTNSIRLTSSRDLLAIVPFVLNFIPKRSILVMSLSDNRLGLTQRMDLPRPEDAHTVGSVLMPSLIDENPDAVVVIGYEDRAGESLPAIEEFTKALAAHPVTVLARIVVRSSRWWSIDCEDPDCCPSEGNLVLKPADVAGIVAELVYQGVAPHPDRESLAKQVEPGPQAVDVAEVLRSKQKARAKAGVCQPIPRAELFAAWPRILDPSSRVVSAEDAALAAVSLLDIEVRDALVAWMCPGTIDLNDLSEEVQGLISGLLRAWGEDVSDPATAEAQRGTTEALIRLCALLPDAVAAPALSVLASFVWWRGDGALARVALDRALRCDTDYRLAQLLVQMLDLAIRPGDH